jgi:hypothetical protein
MASNEKARISFEAILLAPPKVNRLLLSREVRIELKESWNLLENWKNKTRAGGSGLSLTHKTNSKLSLLNEIRIFFQKNPNAEF